MRSPKKSGHHSMSLRLQEIGFARLTEEFGINEENAEVFASGWFAGKYAGVSEVLNVVQKEMDVMEKDRVEKKEMESKTQGPDGYV